VGQAGGKVEREEGGEGVGRREGRKVEGRGVMGGGVKKVEGRIKRR